MATINIEIPEGYKAEWVDGVLTLVDEQPVEFKFKVGDKVKIKKVDQVQTIICIALYNGNPVYKTDGNSTLTEEQIELYTEPKDITERIKTLQDAYNWCFDNGHRDLCQSFSNCSEVLADDKNLDLFAYLKLRIITCALNEGWEPKFDDGEERWYACYDIADNITISDNTCFTTFPEINFDSACRLSFKSSELAEYAATQFKDIYMDFCYKGKE